MSKPTVTIRLLYGILGTVFRLGHENRAFLQLLKDFYWPPGAVHVI